MGLVLACIAMVVIGAVQFVGGKVDRSFESVELAFVSDGLPTCSTDERRTWNTAWAAHTALRLRHQDNGTWFGAANRTNRNAWTAKRADLLHVRQVFGCNPR
jgi:hypothetical protein